MHKENTAQSYEIADVLTKGLSSYLHDFKDSIPAEQFKVLNALNVCRTAKLGAHRYQCNNCEFEKIAYNSCRNRHCPKCQGFARLKWTNTRLRELIPVQYFHLVFTIPSELNAFAIRNKKVIYTILFKSVADTLKDLGHNPKHLGADVGFINVLHTWGQNLMEHPHIHSIFPGGGISNTGEWVNSKKAFLFPVKIMSRLFKGKFLYNFKQALKNDDICFHGQLQQYEAEGELQSLLNGLYKKEWVVFSKAPFNNAEQVVKYLGRYTHRVAISNHRIVKVDEKTVSFRWRNYAKDNENKVMTLTHSEFIRRFMLHILPSGFQKIRYYGFLGNRVRGKALEVLRQLFDIKEEVKKTNEEQTDEVIEMLSNLYGIDVTACPKCSCGKLGVYRSETKEINESG